MKTKADIFTQHYFTFPFIALGVIFLLLAMLLSLMNPVIAIVLFVIGLVMSTTHYRLKIDVKNRKYRDYLWILGFKKGKELPYQNVEYIYFNQLERSSEYGFVARLSAQKVVYQGYVKLSDGEPIFFGENSNEKAMLNKGRKLSELLQIDVRKNY